MNEPEALPGYTGATPLPHARHEEFAQHFVCTTYGNGAKAARLAGYSEDQSVSSTEAHRLLTNADIDKRVKHLQRERWARLRMPDEELLWRAGAVVRADPGRMFRDGKLIPIEDMDDEARAAIGGFELEDGVVTKVRLRDSHAAMKTLMQVRKMLGADTVAEVNVTLAQRMEQARKRVLRK